MLLIQWLQFIDIQVHKGLIADTVNHYLGHTIAEDGDYVSVHQAPIDRKSVTLST